MKVFMLSLVFVLGFSLFGNAKQNKNITISGDYCDTECNFMLQHILEGLDEEHGIVGVDANNIAMPIYYNCRRGCYSR